MSRYVHPARRMPFPDLMSGLARACDAAHVHRRLDVTTGLALYIYTPRCVYEDGWDEISMLARGLIIDEAAERVVATPFPKFFNLGERRGDAPDLGFEAFEKLDGSLIIVFHHAGEWRTATKGAFNSEQAVWARSRLNDAQLSSLTPGTTYLFEAVYPENRIVIRYEDAALVMLGAYHPDGAESPMTRFWRPAKASASGRRNAIHSPISPKWCARPRPCPRRTRVMSCGFTMDCG